MYFAQFYTTSAIDKSKIVEACGDRSVVVLDGRESRAAQHRVAFGCAIERGYTGYTLHKGESFTRSEKIANYISVDCRGLKSTSEG